MEYQFFEMRKNFRKLKAENEILIKSRDKLYDFYEGKLKDIKKAYANIYYDFKGLQQYHV